MATNNPADVRHQGGDHYPERGNAAFSCLDTPRWVGEGLIDHSSIHRDRRWRWEESEIESEIEIGMGEGEQGHGLLAAAAPSASDVVGRVEGLKGPRAVPQFSPAPIVSAGSRALRCESNPKSCNRGTSRVQNRIQKPQDGRRVQTPASQHQPIRSAGPAPE
jgi:hypothetical protein